MGALADTLAIERMIQDNGPNYSLAQVYAFARNELRILAEEIEAGWATRDTNDGSTFCSQCGAPQPKRKKAWKHDPSCEVAIIRARVVALRQSHSSRQGSGE